MIILGYCAVIAAVSGLGGYVPLASRVNHRRPADAFTISTLLLKGGTSRERTLLVQGLFASLIPLGVLCFYLGQSLLAAPLESAFTGSVMALRAGTFLCIALSDLLPEVQFHSHDRVGLFLSVIGGAAMMYATALFEP